jgi:hypothetical protein
MVRAAAVTVGANACSASLSGRRLVGIATAMPVSKDGMLRYGLIESDLSYEDIVRY